MQKDRFLTVGGKRFHFVWLRDNCTCSKCRHPTSFQKLYDISDCNLAPTALNVEVNEKELSLTWNEDPPHHSTFPITWLLLHAYDQQPSPSLHQEILWDKVWIEAHPPQWHDFYSSTFESWINDLFTLGFARLRNITSDDLDSLISSIGPIHYTEYGRYADVKATPRAIDLADTGYALGPHTDYSTYLHTPPLLQFQYCVANEAKGGESCVNDGFRIAKDFHHNHPDYFQILAKTPIQFQQFYTEWRYFFRRTRPILELDKWGEVAGVYFNNSKCWNWDLPFDQIEDFYKAYAAFCRYVKNPAYEYSFKLQPGDCLVLRNSRVFHGRKAFDSSSGNRHLKVAYVEWDYFNARRNFLQSKHLYLSE